jgi:hypothetical protein
MNFVQFTSGSGDNQRTWTPQQQADAWDAYIEQDDYLRSRRGQYAERGAVWLPRVTRADLSVAQELFGNIRGTRNALRLRADVVNVGNLLNKDWGLSQRAVAGITQGIAPLTNPGATPDGRPTYRLRVVNNELITTTFQKTSTRADVYEVQFRLEYTFR